jgi:peptidoglycan hydrolase-like protein with peptidoglycan-binding domain
VPLLVDNLRMGRANDLAEVMELQAFLNTQGAQLPTTGFFGPMTTAAVNAFQRTYASEILAPLGLSAPTGNVYSSTRQKINTLACGGVAPIIASANNTEDAIIESVALVTPKKPANKKVTAKPVTPQIASPTGGVLGGFQTFFKSLFW